TYQDTTAFDNIRIHDLTIMYGRTGLYMTKCSNSLVENVTLKECYRGLYPHSKARENVSDGYGGTLAVADTIRNCTIENFYREGIAVRGEGHQLLNNTMLYTREMETYDKSAGIAIQRSKEYSTTDILVQGNSIDGGSNLTRGIWANRSGGNTYADNTITDVTLYGVQVDGHASGGLGNENTFTNTIISLAAVDSATGIYFDLLADNNLFDGVTIDSAGIAILADDETHGNVIKNGTLDGSSIADVSVLENSNVFMANTPFDTAGSLVEPGSAIFFGEGFTVDLTVTSPFDVPGGPWDVTVTNGIGDIVATFATDADGMDSFKLAETGVSANASDTTWGAQNPYTFVVETGDLYASYVHEFTATLTADTAITLDMDIMWEAHPAKVVTSEAYTFEVPKDTLMLNYLWATNAEDSAAVAAAILKCRETQNLDIIELNADDITFDGNDQVIYGAGGTDPLGGKYYDIQGIWANRIYGDTSEFNNIKISDVTIQWANISIYMTEVRNGLVENCTIKDAYRGIYPNSKQNLEATGCIIQNNTIVNANREAIPVRGPGHKILDNTISANRELNSSSAGIMLSRSALEYTTDNVVKGNVIYGGSFLAVGIRADASGENIYRQNTINDVASYGLQLNSHSSRGLAKDNLFAQTEINLTAADSAVGIYFTSGAAYNVVDTVLVDGAGVAVKGDGGSRANVVDHAIITNSTGYDVHVAGGSSVLIMDRAYVDASKLLVEQGSAIYYDSLQIVDLEVLFENTLPVVGLDVIVTNAGGDTVGTFTTDEEGMAYVDVAVEGVTFAGYSATMNPYTFTVVDDLDEGFSGILGSVTETITEDTDLTLNVEYLGTERTDRGIPTEFALMQNYPNPFNPTTTIRYDLPVQSQVRLRIFDMTGRTIRTLVEANQHASSHRVVWDGRDHSGRPVATGIYFYELVAGDFKQVNKMVLLK
ncbi:MAG: right-handed parallel beta-helix repeat-containing protein, partial [Fidelibacterota bacterium]